MSFLASGGRGHLLHPSRAVLDKVRARENHTARAAPLAPGHGPHAQTAQTSMHALLRSRCSFGVSCIAHQHPSGISSPRAEDFGVPGYRGVRRSALPSLLLSPILAALIISSVAPSRRNRNNDNGRPNGMVGVPALRREVYSRSFSNNRCVQARKAAAIKHTAPSYSLPHVPKRVVPEQAYDLCAAAQQIFEV